MLTVRVFYVEFNRIKPIELNTMIVNDNNNNNDKSDERALESAWQTDCSMVFASFVCVCSQSQSECGWMQV